MALIASSIVTVSLSVLEDEVEDLSVVLVEEEFVPVEEVPLFVEELLLSSVLAVEELSEVPFCVVVPDGAFSVVVEPVVVEVAADFSAFLEFTISTSVESMTFIVMILVAVISQNSMSPEPLFVAREIQSEGTVT
jgi:hypothetical protein